MFSAKYRITPAIAKALMAIEADRQAVDSLPIDLAMLASLRETARLNATHYSTQIEGNRLTQAQVKNVVEGSKFPGRERDEKEVLYYYRALGEVDRLAKISGKIAEVDVRCIHGLVMNGRAKPTPYRSGQNVIRDKRSGGDCVHARRGS